MVSSTRVLKTVAVIFFFSLVRVALPLQSLLRGVKFARYYYAIELLLLEQKTNNMKYIIQLSN